MLYFISQNYLSKNIVFHIWVLDKVRSLSARETPLFTQLQVKKGGILRGVFNFHLPHKPHNNFCPFLTFVFLQKMPRFLNG